MPGTGAEPYRIVDDGDRRSIATAGLALVFERQADRWTHAIEVSRTPGGPSEPIARAVEWSAGADDPDRVVSPVFQEVRFQLDPGGRPQALGLGMSGPHHFSAVFTLDQSEAGVTLDVDLADRCRGGARMLASTYTVLLHSGDLAGSDGSSIAWSLGEAELNFAAGPETRSALAEAGRSATRVQALARDASTPTGRWRYTWRLRGPSPPNSP